MASPRIPPFRFAAALVPLLALALSGCSGGGSKSIAAQFSASTTSPAAGLVKVVLKSRSGPRVVVDVVLYGPEPSLDLYAFRFGVKIGNTTVVKFVPQASYTQTALIAGTGQTISATVDDSMADPSLVQVDVEKQGGGAGNGVAGASAILIELAFDTRTSGSSTLTLVGEGANPPQALDSSLAPIAGVTFDAASAGLTGVSTGGGGGY
jgi:hypothetical protein